MKEYQISKNTIEFNLSRLQYSLLAGTIPVPHDRDVRTADGFMSTIGRLLDFHGAPIHHYFNIQVLRSEMNAILGLEGVKVVSSCNNSVPSYRIEYGLRQYVFLVLFDTKYPVNMYYKDEVEAEYNKSKSDIKL